MGFHKDRAGILLSFCFAETWLVLLDYIEKKKKTMIDDYIVLRVRKTTAHFYPYIFSV